jgi:serine/threonine-protein kinase
MALELLRGRTLAAALREHGPYAPAEAVRLVRPVAEALDYAHAKGVVHRDLKPENVMLLPDGTVKVMDFGVARVEGQPGLTSSQFFFGSPLYAAPELVATPREVDRRADLYSLGVILFELTEGRPPFVHESVYEVLAMHRAQPLPDPAGLARPLPPALWAIVERLLAKQRDQRFGSAAELLVALDRRASAAAPA